LQGRCAMLKRLLSAYRAARVELDQAGMTPILAVRSDRRRPSHCRRKYRCIPRCTRCPKATPVASPVSGTLTLRLVSGETRFYRRVRFSPLRRHGDAGKAPVHYIAHGSREAAE
jgi:hypothetical protein